MNLFQQVCLNNSCKAVNRVYCLKCDKRIEHFACQNNLKDEKGLIGFFEDIGKKIELYIEKLQESLQEILENFNELTYKLRDKYQYNQQRLQELNESKLKTIIDEIFQFQSDFEKGLEKEIQNCSKEMLIQLNNWIKKLSTPIAQYTSQLLEPSISESRLKERKQETPNKSLKEMKQPQKQTQLLDECPKRQEYERYIEYHPSVFQKKKKATLRDPDILQEVFKHLPEYTKFELDPKINKIQNTFKFLSIEINQQSFDSNITQIQRLRIPDDYTVTCHGDRCCVRTLQPLIFSENKEIVTFKDDVFILKKNIGIKQRQMNEAIQESKSHLISKRLMQKFVLQLNEKGCKIPPIIFSDLLILKENEKIFWIAERLQKGDFVRYNSDQGYINSDDNLLSNTTLVIWIIQFAICKEQVVFLQIRQSIHKVGVFKNMIAAMKVQVII
ncbi:unnamed protein product (macronuclear) [Paramecium tetraurelia]|uniref:Alpha-type protein kinase domain-containing protein n=1 Tax=Paramecium tetraurelia TaxID=5888 RepID=A0D8D0_PARTE|nr:uncharacterized protein GSPATT00039315001 [Paramecium tetraurelia]CAK79297.1 unnamed protein product [Paramecium tetraurelia]|eukprot:XP_001446694.1 hypothetical protein (macronuclear) [Paramecium tetraurelia strain d4-2]